MDTNAGNALSLPLRERGLKLHKVYYICDENTSLPLRERGLKSDGHMAIQNTTESLPLRERGLKLTSWEDDRATLGSVP